MKTLMQIAIAMIWLSISTFTFGQKPLPESRRSSAEIFVYKLDEKGVRDLYLKGKNLDESILHTFVARCAEVKDIPVLPRGNYIWVRVVGNKLQYSDHTVDNFCHYFIEDEKVMLFLTDTLGNVIPNATVKRGSKRLQFDGITQTYNTSRIGNGKVVEVNNDGVIHYIELNKESYYHYRSNLLDRGLYAIRNGFLRVFAPDMADIPDKYGGFVVFSKPKYKPGETVRFKAYINHNGKPYKEKTDVSLESYYPESIDTLLTTLQPYRHGMYEWEFQLSDSLKLRLDNNYRIVLKTKGRHTNDISGNFYYEEYELDRITFEVKIDKERYYKGDTVKLHFSASDENGLPVYDGRVDISVKPSKYSERKYYSNTAFIPDETGRHSFFFDDNGPREWILPDSMFVHDVSMTYDVECSFFDASNEKQVQKVSLYMDMDTTAQRLTPGELKSKDTENRNLEYRFFRENGKVRLVVDNPEGFPFWYTIRKGKQNIGKGYVTELDYSCMDIGKEGYAMQLSFLAGGKSKTLHGRLPYMEKNISMEVNTPTTVYPGQSSTVDVLVRDNKGRPVENADITAYAFTSKFGHYSPNVDIYGKSESAKRFDSKRYNTYEVTPRFAMSPMDWEIWRERMGLDSIAYYHFLYPKTCYSYSEKAPDAITQISPYLLIDGALQGVHVLWIDQEPYYFHQAGQLEVYSFPVTPGYHTLQFRTFDRVVTVENVFVQEGMKMILSVNGEKSVIQSAIQTNRPVVDDMRPLQVIVEKQRRKNRGRLSELEMSQLKGHLVTVDNTAGMASLPNLEPFYTPAVLQTGGFYYWLNHKVRPQYNYQSRSFRMESILTGPFPDSELSSGGKIPASFYVDSTLVNRFDMEGAHRYGIWKERVIQDRWGQVPFSSRIAPFTPQVTFSHHALSPARIQEMFHDHLLDRVQQRVGLMVPGKIENDGGCRLSLEIGHFAGEEAIANPLVICLSSEEGGKQARYLYYGATRNFNGIPKGDYRVDLIFRDSTRYATPVSLRENGMNYLKIESIKPMSANSISHSIFAMLQSYLYVQKPSKAQSGSVLNKIGNKEVVISIPAIVRNAGNSEVVTGAVYDTNGDPLIGASVVIEGTINAGITDMNGEFKIPCTDPGNMSVVYIGYKTYSTWVIPGNNYSVTLQEDTQELDEVVVIGFGINKRGSSSGGVLGLLDTSVPSMLEGRLYGMVSGRARGASAIYGSNAANNIILANLENGNSQTAFPDGNSSLDEDGFPVGSSFPEGWEAANSLRTNFHDDAFWHPTLSTGSDGKVSFEVVYPDDMTSWNANFIAVGGRKQTDKAQLNIKSFKPVNAQLFLPRFAIQGDSLNAIGKLTNHQHDSILVKRSIEVQGFESEENISLQNLYVDTIPLLANGPDSISITYSMTMENGYLDGERRSIPVFKPGILETHGEFAVLDDTIRRQFVTNPALGKVVLHAETSALQTFLDEIDKVDRYPYWCNEQMASKLKVLLMKKRIYALIGREFEEERKVRNLIRRLERNQNKDNLWGWWNQDKTEMWISKHIVEVMLDAEADGYKVDFNKKVASDALKRELERGLLTADDKKYPFKHVLLDVLELLKKLNADMDYEKYSQSVSSLPDMTINDNLRSMQMSLLFDLKDKPQIDSLLALSSKTMVGSLYWGEEKKESSPEPFMLPYFNDTENTLVAYHILRETGGHEETLKKIRNYFFEMRNNGFWRNTYESARIMETILPDIIRPESILSDTLPVLSINGNRFDAFPLEQELEAGETIEVQKSGTIPLFFTLYQQAWNDTPAKASEGFSVETSLIHNSEAGNVLEAGKGVDLKVSVTASADAGYVMIEVPIPAGCSYESKIQGDFRKETHREFHKEKVVIFCQSLSKGSHEFTIKLLPRYTGKYHLNPAKAELMYFPTFFGRGESGQCRIQ